MLIHPVPPSDSPYADWPSRREPSADDARPHEPHDTRVESPQPRSAPDSPLFKKLIATLEIQENMLGLTSSLHFWMQGLRDLQSHGLNCNEWLAAVAAISKELRMTGGADPAKDRARATHLVNPKLLFILGTDRDRCPGQQRRVISALAALLLNDSLAHSSSLDSAEISVLCAARLYRAATARTLIDGLKTINAETIDAQRDKYPPQTLERRLLDGIKRALARFSSHPPIESVHKAEFNVTALSKQEADDTPATMTCFLRYAGRLQRFWKHLARFSSAPGAAGCIDLVDHLTPEELASLGQFMAADVAQGDRRAMAILLCLLSRMRPNLFAMLSLSRVLDPTVWLDIPNGTLVWSLNAFKRRSARQSDDLVIIPLPKELAAWLRRRLQLAPDAKFVAELFCSESQSSKQLDQQVRDYLRRHPQTRHRITLERISRSSSRLLLKLTSDEACASRYGCDFSIGPPSQHFYFAPNQDRVTSVFRQYFTQLGLSGELQ